MKIKCLFLGLAMLLSMANVFAQNKNVQTAYNYHKKGQLKEALAAIQLALDPQTKNQEETFFYGKATIWLYYANICLDIAKDPTGAYDDLLDDPLEEAKKGYEAAAKLDIRGEYQEDISRGLLEIEMLTSKIDLQPLIEDIPPREQNHYLACQGDGESFGSISVLTTENFSAPLEAGMSFSAPHENRIPSISKLYKKGSRMSGWGWTLIIVGGLIEISLGTTYIFSDPNRLDPNDYIGRMDDYRRDYNADQNFRNIALPIIIGGAGMIVSGIPLVIAGEKKVKKANDYRNKAQRIENSTTSTLKLDVTGSGIGLVFTF